MVFPRGDDNADRVRTPLDLHIGGFIAGMILVKVFATRSRRGSERERFRRFASATTRSGPSGRGAGTAPPLGRRAGGISLAV